jgi:RNA polymerase sigma factor (TIGR02999 family)
MSSGSADISRLLNAWGAGDQTALERLTPLVYDELRRMARRHMRKERPGNTLQTTALVHEAYLRLVDAKSAERKDRAQFFALSSQIMRRILVDAARARASAKRGGGVEHVGHSEEVNLDEIAENSSQRSAQWLALDEALNDLAAIDPRKARVIELRFFGGLSVEETAEVLKISPQSVMRDWKLARAWLNRELRSL